MHYFGRVTINPVTGLLTADLTLSWRTAQTPCSVWNFYLYHSLSLKAITCNIPINVHHESAIADWNPFIKDARQLQVVPQILLDTPTDIELKVSYTGQIGLVSTWEVNRISPEWVELGLYAPWYPLREDLPLSQFNIDVSLPPQYQVMSGHVTPQGKHWKVESVIPHNTCTILAGPNMLSLSNQSATLTSHVYYTCQHHFTQAKMTATFSQDIITYFNALIGASDFSQQNIVIAPRTKGGGYCRPGLIVLTPVQRLQEQKLFAYLAHETAHIWWYRANTSSWEDWLNESFAEYCALLALRQHFGQDMFLERLAKYRISSHHTPGIKGLARTNPQAHTVLYKKGPLHLHALAERIGFQAFTALLQQMHIKQIKTHQDFLDVLQGVAGEETTLWFDLLLEQ